MNATNRTVIAGLILLFFEALEILYLLLSLLKRNQAVVTNHGETLLPPDHATRRKLILEDSDGSFFKKLNEFAKSGVSHPPQHWLDTVWSRLGVGKAAEKDLLLLQSILVCSSFALLGAVTGIIGAKLDGVFIGVGAGFLVAQLCIVFEASRRIKIRDEILDYWLPITAEQFLAAIIATYDLKTALQSLEKVYVTRSEYNPATELFLEVLTEHRNGKDLSQAFRDVARRCGHLHTKHVFLNIHQFDVHGSEITKPLLDITDNLVARLPVRRSLRGTEVQELMLLVKALIVECKNGLEPISALRQALKNLPSTSLLGSLLEHMLEELKHGTGLYETVRLIPAIKDLPEFEIFLQGLLLSGSLGARFSKILERIEQILDRRLGD